MESKLNINELIPQINQSSVGNIQKTDIMNSSTIKKTEDISLEKTKHEKEYNIDDAVMDLEAIKRFFYMLAGIEYVPKNEFGYEKRSEIWA